ncbi:MAG: Rne/Rng family ribonuclease [Muribaculaceae bacterium]|nr:Rne/Rng family ribonuclease [Muribaculaceae bacterium]
MKSELIVDVSPGDVSIALLEDSRLVSLQKEARNISYAVGDIYLAKVKKLMPGLNAAFVNVGYEKDAFLHYLDLGPYFSSYSEFITRLLEDKKNEPTMRGLKLLPEIDKHGTITDLLQPGRELLVQIAKEPISSKGPRLTTEITFTGRFLVLIPFSDKISISQKIKSAEEKNRLRRLIESIKPKNYGVIIRTSAEGKRVAELNHELRTLTACWEDTLARAQKATAPALIFEEESRIVAMLRDVFSPTFESIYVNDEATFSQIQKYVSLIAPERADIVKLYQKDIPIFDHFAITRQIKSSFGKTVSFKSGAYIIIEHTEALHVIDVNSGNRTKAGTDQETNALDVNLRAADEIARQLRLRDMGGIIVVDFIDMARNEHRQQLYDHMREVMANDRARHNILPLSKFGLMQITRQRVRPAMDITTAEECPSCHGKGEVQPSLLFTDTLEQKLDTLVNDMGKKDFTMYVHPFVDAYIKKGLLTSLYGRWRRRHKRAFKIVPDESLAYLQYRVVDADGNVLDLRTEQDSGTASSDKVSHRANKRGAEQNAEAPEAKTEQPQATPAPKKKKKAATAIPLDTPSEEEKKEQNTETQEQAEAPAENKKKPARRKKTADNSPVESQATDKTDENPTTTPEAPAEENAAPKKRKPRQPRKKRPVDPATDPALLPVPVNTEKENI